MENKKDRKNKIYPDADGFELTSPKQAVKRRGIIKTVKCQDCRLRFDSEIELQIHGFTAHERHWQCEKPKAVTSIRAAS